MEVIGAGWRWMEAGWRRVDGLVQPVSSKCGCDNDLYFRRLQLGEL